MTEAVRSRKRLALAFAVALAGMVVAGLGIAGVFGGQWLGGPMVVAVLAAVLAGVVEGADARSRLLAGESFVIGAVAFTTGAVVYAAGAWPANIGTMNRPLGAVDLLIPAAIAMLPFLAARFLLDWIATRWRGRFFALPATVVLTLGACLLLAGLPQKPEAWARMQLQRPPDSDLVLEFEPPDTVRLEGRVLTEMQLRALLKVVREERRAKRVLVRGPPWADSRVGLEKILALSPLGLTVEGTEAVTREPQ